MERHIGVYLRRSAVEKLLQLIITICLELQVRLGGSADASEVPADLEEGMLQDDSQVNETSNSSS